MDRQVSHQLYLQGAVSTDIGELLLGRSLITSECRWLTNNLMSQAWTQCLNLGLQLLASRVTSQQIKATKSRTTHWGQLPTALCPAPHSSFPLLPSTADTPSSYLPTTETWLLVFDGGQRHQSSYKCCSTRDGVSPLHPLPPGKQERLSSQA